MKWDKSEALNGYDPGLLTQVITSQSMKNQFDRFFSKHIIGFTKMIYLKEVYPGL